MTRILTLLLLGLLILGGGGYVMRGQIALAIYDRAVARAAAQDPIADLPDGLSIGLCGSGSPLPDPRRAGPCVVIIAGTHMYMVDVGEGGVRNLGRMGLAAGRVEGLFLTHFHSDHIDSLGPLMLGHWAQGSATSPLPVFGPEGVDQVVAGFNMAYALDKGYRVAHHGPDIIQPSGFGAEVRPFALSDKPTMILNQNGLIVRAFAVNHAPIEPAVGYSFEYKGRKIVVSGDTTKTPAIVENAKGADILAHEALSSDLVGRIRQGLERAGKDKLAHIMNDIPGYHTSPEEAAEQARDAGVSYLLLYHIVPALPFSALEGPFLGKARDIFNGTIRVGHDGDFITLPANSKAINVSNRID
jgi:ribonuclease Z